MVNIVHEALTNAAAIGGSEKGKWVVKLVDGTSIYGHITKLPTGGYSLKDVNNGNRYVFHPSMVVFIHA